MRGWTDNTRPDHALVAELTYAVLCDCLPWLASFARIACSCTDRHEPVWPPAPAAACYDRHAGPGYALRLLVVPAKVVG